MADGEFLRAVQSHGGHAAYKNLSAGRGDAAGVAVVMRAQKHIRDFDEKAYEKQFTVLPQYLANSIRKNPTSFYRLETEPDGRFKWAYLCFGFVAEALRVCGRTVCSTDFGHMKNGLFQGTEVRRAPSPPTHAHTRTHTYTPPHMAQ